MARRRSDTSASGDSADGDPRRELGYAKPGRTARRPAPPAPDLGQWAKETSAQLDAAGRPPSRAALAAREAWTREDFTERAAIYEHLGGWRRLEAERMAREATAAGPIRYMEAA